jgi:hypothetical protein
MPFPLVVRDGIENLCHLIGKARLTLAMRNIQRRWVSGGGPHPQKSLTDGIQHAFDSH